MEMQRNATSPGSRTTELPQLGHTLGISQMRASGLRRESTGPSTSGITSPAFRTMTVSPTRTSLRCTSSKLCSVARATVEPATTTGTSSATGVSAPVRPTCTVMSRRSVVFSSGGNLNAMAQRGARAVNPMARWRAKSFTFTTTPSIS